MDLEMLRRQAVNRRSFVRGGVATGMSLVSLDVLAACGGETSSNTGPVTVTVTDKPGQADKAGSALYNQQVAAFQKLHSHYKIVAHNYFFDPATYYARFAGHQAEDAVRVYLTEPQYMISHHFVADVSDLVKQWQYFSSIAPSMIKAISDQSGRIYAMPRDGYKLSLVYNRKVFQQAGLDPDKPPTTWDDFKGYARQIAGKGVAGFMPLTTANQGGWHFTNWLYTAGGKAETQQNGKWVPSFNSPQGAAVLQMLKDMRWKDHSIGEKVLVDGGVAYQALGKGSVGMIIGGGGDLAGFHNDFKTPVDQFGVGPVPTNGGDGVLGGGNVWVFNPGASQDVIQGAIDWIEYHDLDLKNFEDNLKTQAAAGTAIGYPDNSAFTGTYAQQRNEIIKKYANIPQNVIQAYLTANQSIVPEPPFYTQQFYALMDPVVQKALSDQSFDPQKALDDVASSFQPTLDQANA